MWCVWVATELLGATCVKELKFVVRIINKRELKDIECCGCVDTCMLNDCQQNVTKTVALIVLLNGGMCKGA